MTLTYSLTQDDYLNHQLFMASLSETVKTERRKSWVLWSIAFLCLGWLFYQKDNFLAYYFWGFGVLYIISYPYYSRWFYKRHYKKYVNETYKNRFGKTSTVTIDNDHIHDIDETGETKISISEVEKIFETTQYFFLKLKSGITLIIPKHKLDSLDLVTKELKTIAENRSIDFIEMHNWRWT